MLINVLDIDNRVKVYFAGKPHRMSGLRQTAELWKDRINCTSTWFLSSKYEAEILTGQLKEELWVDCIEDVKRSDALFIFCQEGDTLKGCLIEAGAALAKGIPVYQIGTCHSLQAGDGSDASFVYHPLWNRANTIEDAFGLYLKQRAELIYNAEKAYKD